MRHNTKEGAKRTRVATSVEQGKMFEEKRKKCRMCTQHNLVNMPTRISIGSLELDTANQVRTAT